MRLVNIWVGLGIFSLVIALLFGFAAKINTNYGTDQEDTYTQLAADYNKIDLNDTSTIRKVADKAEEAEFGAISAAASALDNVLEGIKLFGSSVTTVAKLSDDMAEDSEGRIDPLIPMAIKYVFTIIIVIITIATLWRFRPEA